ncbi:polysaccharide deacetylase family protein [Flavobacterium sp. NRK F10]|uniref:polysaccharide deacetylase family protein n=1 Tax=Flavobacterium sp. NRK F10 TaxID=2954931 RepID=UPI00209046E5|nr:polysaccharide deacetylase family protein [Flavobacterium sp. NRK F10]MCO6173800.1 polysaccharide deacetylase family protein [Flavobacterium sp. NRK F10]
MKKLSVLMYHNFTTIKEKGSGLTIHADLFESQLQYLVKKNYKGLHFKDIIANKDLPEKSIILTFDDVTVNQLEIALPLLQKYNFKATFFIPFAYVGKSDLWNSGTEKIMTVEQLKSLPADLIELGHHSFEHKRFKALSILEAKTDLERSNQFIKDNQLEVVPAIAYPYGSYPKEVQKFKEFKTVLKESGILFGLRIGNKINRFPFKEPYLIKRVDVKGEDNLLRFSIKMLFGRIKLF